MSNEAKYPDDLPLPSTVYLPQPSPYATHDEDYMLQYTATVTIAYEKSAAMLNARLKALQAREAAVTAMVLKARTLRAEERAETAKKFDEINKRIDSLNTREKQLMQKESELLRNGQGLQAREQAIEQKVPRAAHRIANPRRGRKCPSSTEKSC